MARGMFSIALRAPQKPAARRMPTLLENNDLVKAPAAYKSLEAAIQTSQKQQAAAEARPRQLTPRLSESAPGLIIFDWDDTLFPTTAVTLAENLRGSRGVLRLYGQALAHHARVVEQTLRAAAACCRVCIVTLASRKWFDECADLYLPGIQLRRLLRELDIPVYYSRDHADVQSVGADFGMQRNMKMTSMAHAVNEAYASEKAASHRLNVISVGDSAVEHVALQELLRRWTADKLLLFKPARKALKLMERPDLVTLTCELDAMKSCLAGMHSHAGDLDVTINTLSDFKTGALSSFSSPDSVDGDVVGTVWL